MSEYKSMEKKNNSYITHCKEYNVDLLRGRWTRSRCVSVTDLREGGVGLGGLRLHDFRRRIIFQYKDNEI